jgi:hypothetical protein
METFQFRVSLDGAEEDVETSTILIGLTNSIGGFESIFPEANVNFPLCVLICRYIFYYLAIHLNLHSKPEKFVLSYLFQECHY